ncbi:hypothetical protein JCM19237_4325 [Photobacterium aphoticum]|uniref:Uncharacterized protein n=1 Tax=Photobacterium aphoticum TaxID=754436 RepID=A0A090QT14_9GAMM|nr:hypothetical protein JCM19237_4325 [Photobacterium aphoticum]
MLSLKGVVGWAIVNGCFMKQMLHIFSYPLCGNDKKDTTMSDNAVSTLA